LSLRALLLCVAAAAPALGFAKPLPLWELEAGDNRVLLMGSVHFLRPGDYPLRPGIESAYELADTIVMEIDLASTDPVTTQATLAELSIDPEGRGLAALIGQSDYAEVARKATALGIPELMFQQVEPWFAALAITQLRMLQLGFDPAWGVETRIGARAAADGKDTLGLETLAEQLGFLDTLDPATQEAFLMQSLDDAAQLQAEVETIISAWRDGDAAALEQSLLDGLQEAPGLYEALLVRRNRNWVAPIRDLTRRRGNYLVIVGAMHLVGEDSVLAMLEEAGIKSRQLDDSDF
jgi:uncharacterized protein YbaP (TraB family)